MQNKNTEYEFWLKVITIVGATIIVMTLLITSYNAFVQHEAFKYGYEKGPVLGSQENFYQKVK